jgi:hypothetical protein
LLGESAREFGEPNLRRRQNRPLELGVFQIGILELGAFEARSLKLRKAQIGALKLRAS